MPDSERTNLEGAVGRIEQHLKDQDRRLDAIESALRWFVLTVMGALVLAGIDWLVGRG